jgi:hypothetical protein
MLCGSWPSLFTKFLALRPHKYIRDSFRLVWTLLVNERSRKMRYWDPLVYTATTHSSFADAQKFPPHSRSSSQIRKNAATERSRLIGAEGEEFGQYNHLI